MSQVNNFKINAEEGTITYSKKFMKAAGVYNSKEYRILQKLTADFPNYVFVQKVIDKNKDKKTFRGLSIKEMRRFISENRSSDELLMFEKVVLMHEGKQGKYAAIKKWFLENYKKVYTTAMEEFSKDIPTEKESDVKAAA